MAWQDMIAFYEGMEVSCRPLHHGNIVSWRAWSPTSETGTETN